MGLFGHNLFRFSWLWYGGFLIIARHVMIEQAVEVMQTEEMESFEMPEDWEWHAGHAPSQTVHC
jgi:hypothetical protein